MNKEYLILNKYKYLNDLFENYVCNIPKKDEYYKTEIRITSSAMYKSIVYLNEFKCIDKYLIELIVNISYLNYLFEILFKKKYINQKNLEKIVYKLTEISKMVYGYTKRIGYGS